MTGMFLRLALRNVFRQRLRTATTLIAIVSGVAGLILAGGFVQDIYLQLGEAVIHSHTGHVQVFRTDYLAKGTRKPDQFLIPDPAQLSTQIQALPGVKQVSSRLSFAGLVSNGRTDLAVIGEGIEPEKESELSAYLQIAAGRQMQAGDKFGLLAGQGVAQTLGLEPGDSVTLLASTGEGALNSLDFEVVGVFQSFSKDYDARAVRIPLSAAQELMLTDGANLMVVSLNRTPDTDQVSDKVGEIITGKDLEVRTWRTLSDFYDKTVQMYDRQFGVLKWIILLMVLLSVTNSVNMSTFERQGELGTMQALGNPPSAIFKLLVTEGLLLGLFGATLGATVGVAAALAISAVGIPMPPPPNSNVGYTALIRVGLETTFDAWLVGLVATVGASFFPAYRSMRKPVVEALRQAV